MEPVTFRKKKKKKKKKKKRKKEENKPSHFLSNHQLHHKEFDNHHVR